MHTCFWGTVFLLSTFMMISSTPLQAVDPFASFDILGDDTRGQYFIKKEYTPEPLPTFAASRNLLPNPVIDRRPELSAMYWKCWELAFHHLHQPPTGSPLVSNWARRFPRSDGNPLLAITHFLSYFSP